ncbi:uncharacterized protein LOC132637940 [Lycium barbarum]|uniref:uncharacterized protein LOC132637940 n=1 Tax=Lycium barbarum TaxID=112863 RepID=UPI00293E7143|nr:uncharacterized protein LOC132637940 [Lycium barbarum]
MADIEQHVRVALYWGGKTIHDADTVRYSCGPRVFVKLPVSLTYARLVKLLHQNMVSSIEDVKLVISGRFPYSVVGHSVCYTEMPIVGDESLQDFLVVPDTVRSFMALILLEMYIKSEVAVASEPPSNVMNNFSDIGCHTKVATQNTQPQLDVPSGSCGQGNQNVSTNFSVGTFPSFGVGDGEGTNSTAKMGDVPKASQIQVRMNSDPCLDGSHDDSNGDAPHDANESVETTDSGGKSDGDEQQQAEDVSNGPVQMDVNIGDVPTVSQIQDRVNGSHDDSEGDAPHESHEIIDSGGKGDDDDQRQAGDVSNVPVQMDEFSSLSELQGRPEVFASTCESENLESRVWMDWKTDLKSGMLFASKEDLKSVVILWNLQHNREFYVLESSRNAWKVVCGQWEYGCSWMLRGRKTPSNLWKVGYQSKEDLWKIGKYDGPHSCQMQEPSEMVYNRSFSRQAERMKTTHIRYAMDIGHSTYPNSCGICKETGHHWHSHR